MWSNKESSILSLDYDKGKSHNAKLRTVASPEFFLSFFSYCNAASTVDFMSFHE